MFLRVIRTSKNEVEARSGYVASSSSCSCTFCDVMKMGQEDSSEPRFTFLFLLSCHQRPDDGMGSIDSICGSG